MSIRVDKVQLEIEVREHKRDAEIVKLNKELGEAGRKYRSLQNEVDKFNPKCSVVPHELEHLRVGRGSKG